MSNFAVPYNPKSKPWNNPSWDHELSLSAYIKSVATGKIDIGGSRGPSFHFFQYTAMYSIVGLEYSL